LLQGPTFRRGGRRDRSRKTQGGAAADIEPRELSVLLEGGWREWKTAAWLIAVAGRTEFRARLGELLLASEVCIAGRGYCVALACFGTEADAQLLITYLDRYLPRLELHYDQGMALGALLHLDAGLGTDHADRFLRPGGLWKRWTDGPPSKPGYDHEPFEHLGAFALLPDGFCVSWLPAERSRVVAAGRHARVARHDADGARLWSTPAVLDELSFPGCVEISAETNGGARPSKPWKPRTIEAHHWEPLLVSGHRVAATFADGNSGIAVTFFLDTDTGRLVVASRPGPSQHKAISGPGEFLIGSQGYGGFSTARYDPNGAVEQEWPTHAMPLVDRHGKISGPESTNAQPSRSHFVSLDPDGTVHRGPALSGYYTSYPALDNEGTAVFWRAGQLLAVDADFQMRELFALEGEKRSVMSRVILLDQGQLAFALHDELFILRSTGLGPLDSGVWPCADGGLRGNPVAHQ